MTLSILSAYVLSTYAGMAIFIVIPAQAGILKRRRVKRFQLARE
jgi:hypothetical protein